jgi:hypothetical protein
MTHDNTDYLDTSPLSLAAWASSRHLSIELADAIAYVACRNLDHMHLIWLNPTVAEYDAIMRHVTQYSLIPACNLKWGDMRLSKMNRDELIDACTDIPCHRGT